MKKILGIGDTDVDMYIKVPKLAGHDEKVKGELLGEFPGGMIGNFCSAASKFIDGDIGIISAIGDDSFGVLAKEACISTGIDISGLQTMKGIKTFYCVVMLDPTGEKALTLVPTEAMFPKIEDINPSIIQSADYIHTTGGNPELLTYICTNKSPQTKLSIDVETTMLGKILEKNNYMQSIDYLFINEQTFKALYPHIDYETGIKDLSEKGPPLVIVTLGSKGSIAYDKSSAKFTKQPAFNVPVVDTTGAGDCFNAIFIASMAHGFSLEESMLYSSAGAALSIQSYGARSTQPNLSMVLDFIKQRKND